MTVCGDTKAERRRRQAVRDPIEVNGIDGMLEMENENRLRERSFPTEQSRAYATVFTNRPIPVISIVIRSRL